MQPKHVERDASDTVSVGQAETQVSPSLTATMVRLSLTVAPFRLEYQHHARRVPQ